MSNLCVFVGRLTRDPEARNTASKKLASFGLAIDNKKKNQAGEWESDPIYIDCDAWDKLADTVLSYLSKGDMVYVQCVMRNDKWVDKNTGENRSKFKFTVKELKMLSSKKNDKNDVQEKLNNNNEEEVPF